MLSREEILNHVEKLRVEADKVDEECYHKDMWSNPYRREIQRLQILLKFTDLGIQYELGPSGFIKIPRNGRKDITYAILTGKWRVEGGKTWYRSGKVETFVNKFVLDESSAVVR